MTTSRQVLTAVFPVAGLGTRFLPATKASPKEMLPIVDKPLIQYAVEEAYAAGVRHMVFVTGRSKRASGPLPWRWVTDELRALDDRTLLGMTRIDLPGLRGLAFPFLLEREA